MDFVLSDFGSSLQTLFGDLPPYTRDDKCLTIADFCLEIPTGDLVADFPEYSEILSASQINGWYGSHGVNSCPP